jgi:hypothetical protein
MNQSDLQTLAEERIKDARALLDGQRWAFAYYAAGYAVECALKSCFLARMVHTGWVFQDKVKIDECLVHDFNKLVKIAGLQDELNTELASSAAAGAEFVGYWGVVKDWQVTSRYTPRTKAEAEGLYEAITHDPHGVLRWIKRFW